MLQIEDYLAIDSINHFEFGFALSVRFDNPVIQVIVVDHEDYKVRTLDQVYTVGDAYQAIKTQIQSGFNIEGLLFSGIPDYTLPPLMINGYV